ncbi:YiiX family permuted papain-like enzyme [Pseudothauera lacus]|uniref:YiiX family permuted papain-like enzyme n=1 Tax=Pseudothauera lacus TaxID=2136175 RepID=UPI001C635150|nr:YiiX family permuted papain-like enzyme [Pseudothauera lacus]
MRLLLISLLFILAPACHAAGAYQARGGDIIFHTSRSAQSLAVQKATASPYSHMGMVFIRDGQALVLEAVEPVKFTPLADWVRRGEGGRFVVRRLVDAGQVLTAAALQRLLAEGEALLGRPYDLYFEWSDERVYCSELVWKVYQRALGIEIGALQTISEFDLSHPAVQAKIRERWPGQPPADEQVISPAAMFASDRLVTVYEN